MIILAGPFIGEFGWELIYWHGWLRYIKKKYPRSKMIISSYPGREQLYEFADHFIPHPNNFIKKNYSQRAFFLDYNENNISTVRKDIEKLYDYIKGKIGYRNYLHISCFPQKVKTTNLIYRVKHKFNFLNREKDPVLKFNKFAGKFIKEPFHINFPYNDRIYYPQSPNLYQQHFKELQNSKKAKIETNAIIKKYNKKNIFTLFPRKRDLRRVDKNWGEENWRVFINLLIKKYDPLIIICGTINGSYFSDIKNNKNIFNSIKYSSKNILDTQISFIKSSSISIHGLSGSALLSLLCRKKTFMYGTFKEYDDICVKGNPLNTEILFYDKEGLAPKPNSLFKEFIKFYEKN